MHFTVKYNGRIGEQTDQTARGILDNAGAVIVGQVVGAQGEKPGDHVLQCTVDNGRFDECCAQLDQYKIDWFKGHGEGEKAPAGNGNAEG